MAVNICRWYVDSNWNGGSLGFDSTTPDIPDLATYAMADKFSSGQLYSENYEVTLYDLTNYGGASMTFRAPQWPSNLSDYGFNDKAQSVKCVNKFLQGAYCIAYRDINAGGKSVYFPAGTYNNLGSTQIGNDTISSLRLGPYTRVILFKDVGCPYPPGYEVYENNTISSVLVTSTTHNDWASSMIVQAY